MPVSNKKHSIQDVSSSLIALVTWFSIAGQFYLTDLKAVDFFSYFTTLCNLLIAVSLTFSSLLPLTKPGIFFSKLSVQSAIALYIFIVSLVYNVALRGILVLKGWEYFLDNMVHVVNPILYILYWFFFRKRVSLKWADGIRWILFPLVYLIYSLVRGSVINWYPYPFLNAGKLGYPRVFSNIGIMLVVFFIGGMLLITATRSSKLAYASREN